MKAEKARPASPSRVSLRLLEIFMAVADGGTMSAAGERLGMSQAAVSQAITQLEDVLAVVLFDRSVRPPALTLVGTSVLRTAREVATKVREVEDVARHGASGRVPLLRIGMLDSFTSTAGAPMLLQLKELAHEWTVTSGFKGTSLQALLDREADVIITSDEKVHPGILARPVLTEPFVLVLPMAWRGPLDDVAAIAAEVPFIRYGRASHMGSVIQGYFAHAGLEPRSPYQFDTTDAALKMVAAGFGWTIMTPLVYLKSAVSTTAAQVVPVPGNAIRRTLVVAVRANEGDELLGRVGSAAVATLRAVVQPRIENLLPQCARQFRVAPRAPARKAA